MHSVEVRQVPLRLEPFLNIGRRGGTLRNISFMAFPSASPFSHVLRRGAGVVPERDNVEHGENCQKKSCMAYNNCSYRQTQRIFFPLRFPPLSAPSAVDVMLASLFLVAPAAALAAAAPSSSSAVLPRPRPRPRPRRPSAPPERTTNLRRGKVVVFVPNSLSYSFWKNCMEYTVVSYTPITFREKVLYCL